MKKHLWIICIVLILLIFFFVSNAKKEAIGPNYAKSPWFVYHDQSSWMTNYKRIGGADHNSFVEVTKEGGYDSYAKDKNNVYYRTEKIAGADPKTFSSLESSYGTSWAKDNNYVYFKGEVISGADAKAQGETLACGYYKDMKHVFFENRLIEEADPVTFIVRDNCLGTDNLNIFWKNMKIAGSSGFTIIGTGNDGYFRNKQNVYYIKQTHAANDYIDQAPIVLLKNANPALFKEYPGYGKIFGDGTHFYSEGQETQVKQ